MKEPESATTKSGHESAPKQPEPRAPRSIRFSDSEWAGIEKEAKARGMTAAELVRHAAVGLSAGKLAPASAQFPPEIAAQIERIYRGVYLLSTLKRDGLVREGRQNELDSIAKAASESQRSILKNTSAPIK